MVLIYFLFILGIIIFVHELGHFIFAKRANIYVYEFALGMGPKLISFKRKNDETTYSIRMIPLGGFVQMAGEGVEIDKNIPSSRNMHSKTWSQRFITVIAGSLFNFLLAFFLFLGIGLIYGSFETRPFLGKIEEGYPAYYEGLNKGDLILSINGNNMRTWDDVLLYIELTPSGDEALDFKIKKQTGEIQYITLQPIIEDEVYKYGLTITDDKNYGVLNSIKFATIKFRTIVKSMFIVLSNLITGNLGFENLAGPVGIYNIIGQEVQTSLVNSLYIISVLSINIGFINLIPFPAFDGGRILFLVIEKIKGSKVDPKVENIIHAVGFGLLILLMLIITIQDIKRLFI